jgi:transcriptional regulator with XRE-family HTH domain
VARECALAEGEFASFRPWMCLGGRRIRLSPAEACANLAVRMATGKHRPLLDLVREARFELGLSQEKFGVAVGASHRTAVRWDARQSTPGAHHLAAMAQQVHRTAPALAAEIAVAAGETLASLGLEKPPPPLPPPAPPPVARPEDLVDIVVLVAVEHSGALPAVVRPWLHAVFKRVDELGLTPAAVERALRPPPPAAPDKAQASRRERPSAKDT